MKVIVVTGGIGSGKSSACSFLQSRYGWPVYKADDKVKELYVKYPELLAAIEKELTGSFRNRDGAFDPAKLAAVIFSDRSSLEKVEELVFPVLTQDFEAWKASQEEASCVLLESATILEKPSLKNLGDVVVVVDAPMDIRRSRASIRDRVPEASIARRMDSQKLMNEVSEGREIPGVDHVILNDSSEEDLHERLLKVAELIA